MKTSISSKAKLSFLGVIRTPRGSTILIAVENMPIASTGVLRLPRTPLTATPPDPKKAERVSVKAVVKEGESINKASLN